MTDRDLETEKETEMTATKKSLSEMTSAELHTEDDSLARQIYAISRNSKKTDHLVKARNAIRAEALARRSADPNDDGQGVEMWAN